MKIPQYAGDPGGRRHSPAIWYDFPIESIQSGRSRLDGAYFEDDFVGHGIVAAGAEADYPPYKGFASVGGSSVDGAEQYGSVLLSSDGDNEGASIRLACPFVQISSNMGLCCFEARIKVSQVATDSQFGVLCGLIESCTLGATIPLTALGALADQNLVGFHLLEGDADQLDTVYKANGVAAVTVKADAITLVADTWVKIGMRFDPFNSNLLTFYEDGAALADTKTIPNATGTDFPADVLLGPVIAILNAAAAPGNVEIDWWACGQVEPT